MNKRKGTFGTAALNTPFVVWSAIFIIVPLIFVIYYSFFDQDSGVFTLDHVKYFFGNPSVLKSFGQSVWLSVASTLISLLIAYPFAYFLSKKRPASQRVQMVLVMAPMWMNMVVRTYSWATILEKNGLLNNILESMGLGKINIIGTSGAVILGMVYNYLPYMILPIYTSMSKIGTPLLEAAEDLGCNSFQKLTRVIMPLSLSGVVSGIIMVFVPSISTFYISQAMSDRKILLIGDIIESQITGMWSTGGLNRGAAMSFVLMVIILICTFIMNKYADSDEGGMMI